jgi:hypothetical protein
MVWGLVHSRTAVLRRRQVELEAKVYERTAELENLSRELQIKSAALEASSLIDPLTGLHNRRFLNQYLDAEITQALRRHEEHRQHRGRRPGPEGPRRDRDHLQHHDRPRHDRRGVDRRSDGRRARHVLS